MTVRPTPSMRPAWLTKLLAVALIVVAVLPILVFATDFTNSGVLQSARARVAQRAGQGAIRESDDARRERVRLRRASRHPTVPTVAFAVVFQFVMLVVFAAVGRRIFALRL